MARPHPARRSGASRVSVVADGSDVLHEKLQRYELIFRATNDVLYDLNLSDATVDWNEALYTQYGYDQSEPAGTLEWWTSHVHPDDALLLENKLTEIFEGDTNSWQYDYRFQRADGSYSYVRDRGLLLRGDDGRPIRIIGSLLDITAQKQLDTAKDEFVSLVSHQLRTPLTVIRVYGEMLTSGIFGSLSDEQTKWVRNMTNSSVRLIDVVGAILHVSRLDLGRVKISVAAHDVVRIIQSCISEVQPLADEKRVHIGFASPRKPVLVNVDETIFVQIVHNLLTNAVRYTKPQKGRITVGLKTDKQGYLLSVHDNGIGIPKAAREHIFERFYRAKNAVSMEVQGSGLGLYLVKVLCDTFGGTVWFESSEGRGTTFYVRLPRHGMTAVV
ncbi:MAG TPA: PAS domain-containing sensor histidine kinase [Candidatus Saccharimonadales bacterium]|nr:PAS domain-containing sensor histidine kinase [Candidatus Saccharimonadales bacterium]